MFRAQTKDGQEVKGGVVRASVFEYIKNNNREYSSYLIVEKCHGFTDKKDADIEFTFEEYEVIPSTIAMKTGQFDNTKWEELTQNEKDEWLKETPFDDTCLLNRIKEWQGREIYGSFKLDGVMTKGGDVVMWGKVEANVRYREDLCAFEMFDVKLNHPIVMSVNRTYKIIGKQYEVEG